MTYTKYSSSMINLTTILDILNIFSSQNNFGANTTVTYHTPFFWGLSTIKRKVPVTKINPDDYIVIKITIPDDLKNNNLFNVTPYFFEYDNVNVFASTDETIPFFNDLTPGKVHKICITSSTSVADKYKKRGYIISKLPVDLLDISSFTLLFRLGILEKSFISFESISSFVTCDYYKSQTYSQIIELKQYYTSDFIKKSRAPNLKQPICDLTKFENTKTYYISKGFTQYQSYKYLSNFYNTYYAMKHVYDAISIKPFAQLQADNSLEAYFNSSPINLSGIKYIYIVAVNHNKLGIALTSNIQIYNCADLKPIKTFETSPELPSMTSSKYPFVSKNKLPDVRVIKLNVSKRFRGIYKILFVERICYDPITFGRPSYNYDGNFAIFTEKM
jgi:hypothetical protein